MMRVRRLFPALSTTGAVKVRETVEINLYGFGFWGPWGMVSQTSNCDVSEEPPQKNRDLRTWNLDAVRDEHV